MAEETVVLLGVVHEKQSVDSRSPYICKAGGHPVWFAGKEPAEAKTLVCPKCKELLFLVAQVYAPVDSDRTLYVFGCNSAECTETPGSWRVLRDQSFGSVSSVEEQKPTTATQPVAPAAPASGGWTNGDDDSDWSDDDDEEEDKETTTASSSAFDDIELLLRQRDAVMSSPAPAKPVTSTPTANKTEVPATPTTIIENADTRLNAFPALAIEVIDEPYEDYTKENDYSHENELLKAYIKSEEEEKSADVSDLRRLIAGSKKGGVNAASSSGGSGAVAGSGESYERTPAQLKHFQRFQKRISRCPLQVLRYDYGGEPLWPVPMQPNKVKVPKCVCGEERAFEMQLTPTINYFLKVDDYAHKKIELPQQAGTPIPATGGGMDWSSVVVYSCSRSCSQSHEEFVYVLPASPA